MRSEQIHSWFRSLVELIFPTVCNACEQEPPVKNGLFCMKCLLELPESTMYLDQENELTEKLWGRSNIITGAGLYIFHKEGLTQQIIHRIKYKNQPQLGVDLGAYFGNILNEAALYKDIDYIIPIPLHKKKEAKRGYNQSMKIAIGISKAMQIPILDDVLLRIKDTKTQTQRSKRERKHNMQDAFVTKEQHRIQNKSVMIVDDVITTGATMELCVDLLNKEEGCKVYVCVIGVALN